MGRAQVALYRAEHRKCSVVSDLTDLRDVPFGHLATATEGSGERELFPLWPASGVTPIGRENTPRAP